MRSCLAKLATAAAFLLAAPAAWAAPEPWGIDLQPAATESADKIHSFHELLLYIIIGVTLFVLALLIIVMVRFNRRANPVPSKTTHNTLIEVIWTIVPVMILVVIAVPSFKLLYANEKIPSDIALTIKAIGKQWFWTYEYPDNGNFTFDATMLADDARGDQPRLLAVDNFMVVPEDTKVRLIVTASDVIHSWAMPAFGKKIDAVPGRLNELWFEARDPGIYYGQCSFICGQNHAYMPIAFRVVSQERYAAWLAEAKQKFANAEDAGRKLAAASK